MRELAALYLRHLALGYPKREALRLAIWCLDPSQPAPGWTHKEQMQ